MIMRVRCVSVLLCVSPLFRDILGVALGCGVTKIMPEYFRIGDDLLEKLCICQYGLIYFRKLLLVSKTLE